MQPHYVEAGSSRIAVVERNPESNETIVFLHGNSGSTRYWHRQFNSPSLEKYRLIAMDLPSHGSSTALDLGFDFSVVAIGAVVKEALLKLVRGPFVLVAFSLGTNIAAEMIVQGLRPSGVFLESPCLVNAAFGPIRMLIDPHSILFVETVDRDAAVRFFTDQLRESKHVEAMVDDYYKVKGLFRADLIRSAGEGKFSDEISWMKEMSYPVAVVASREDKLITCDYLVETGVNFWRSGIQYFDRAGHFVNLDRPGPYDALLSDYVGECFTAGRS